MSLSLGVLQVYVKGNLHPVRITCMGKYEVLEDRGTHYLHYWAWSLEGLQHRIDVVEKGYRAVK